MRQRIDHHGAGAGSGTSGRDSSRAPGGEDRPAATGVVPEDRIPPMMTLIHRGSETHVYRAPARDGPPKLDDGGRSHPGPGGRFLAVKVPSDQNPSPAVVSRLNNEYNVLTRHLSAVASARKAVRISTVAVNQALYLEWVDGTTLGEWTRRNPVFEIPPSSAGSVGISDGEKERLLRTAGVLHRVAAALAEAHGAKVSHNDISAESVLIVDESYAPPNSGESDRPSKEAYHDRGPQIKIIGWGYATLESSAEFDDQGCHANDDLYNLGGLFREVLREHSHEGDGDGSSNGPLDDDDDYGGNAVGIPGMDAFGDFSKSAARGIGGGMKLRLHPNTPRSLLRVTSDLMEVGTDFRPFASAQEVADDLHQMVSDPDRFLFDRSSDHPGKDIPTLEFRSDILYGREEEMSTLSSVFQRFTSEESERSEIVILSGNSGVGKSNIAERFRLQTERRTGCGHLVSGKFDQLQQNLPYSAILMALSELCEKLLSSENAESLADIRDNIMSAIGVPGARVLLSSLPCLRMILGHAVDDVPGAPRRKSSSFHSSVSGIFANFKLIVCGFIGAVCCPGNAVTLFLDDLQFADGLSIQLLSSLVTGAEIKPLLLVGTYCGNEVGPEHPLQGFLEEINAKGLPVTKIEVGNLQKEDVNYLVSDTLCMTKRLTRPLANLVYHKTQGNLFLVRQFLQSLCCREMLIFDSDALLWRWDEVRIQAEDIIDDVAELLTVKIRKLPEELQDILKLLACVGSHFDSSTVKLITTAPCDKGGSWSQHFKASFDCERSNCLVKMAVEEGVVDELGGVGEFRFHDQIQHAAYSLIPESERAAIHLHIGELMCQNASAAQLDEKLYVVVGQLNRGSGLITDTRKQDQLAGLNLHAGEKAMSSSAFSHAVHFFNSGIAVLGEDAWERQYGLTLNLYNSCAEAELCCANFVRVEVLLETVFAQAMSFHDKITGYFTLIKSLGARNRFREAIDMGFDVLGELGKPLPKSVPKIIAAKEFMKAKLVLRGKTDAAILSLPLLEDEKKIDVIKMMSAIGVYVFLERPDLLPVVIFRMVIFSISYGTCEASAFAMACYGAILSGSLGKQKEGYRFGQLALAMAEKPEANDWVARVHTVFYAAIHHFSHPIKLSLEPLMNAHRIGLKAGDIECSVLSLHLHCDHSFHSGESLIALEEKSSTFMQISTEHGQIHALNSHLPVRQAVLKLIGRSFNSVGPNGDAIVEKTAIENVVEVGNQTQLRMMYIFRMVVSYLFGDFEVAAEMAEKSRNMIQDSSLTVIMIRHSFFDGLIAFSLAKKSKKSRWKKIARRSMKKMQKWAKQSPRNHSHCMSLLKAEFAVLKGRKEAAVKLYDAAINAANQNEFLNDEALANERAGFFQKEYGDLSLATQHLARAHACYMKWGAHAKAESLKTKAGSLVHLVQFQ